MVNNAFSFCMPVEFSKGNNDEWKIRGLASTDSIDLQGEQVKQAGLDISALKAGLGLFNYDHEKGPENIIGAIEKADQTPEGLHVEGYLFKHQPRAKAFYDIMRSLKPEQARRVQMSIEGKIIRRDGEDGKVIAQAKVEKVALTVDPVNTDTYTEILKSLNKSEIVEAKTVTVIDKNENVRKALKAKLNNFLKVKLINKALSAGTGYTGAPTDMSGGSVLTGESLDEKTRDLKGFDDDEKKVIRSMALKLSNQFPHMSKYKVLKCIMSRVKQLNQ